MSNNQADNSIEIEIKDENDLKKEHEEQESLPEHEETINEAWVELQRIREDLLNNISKGQDGLIAYYLGEATRSMFVLIAAMSTLMLD